MFEIKRYSAEQADNWNRFVLSSKNGTFLFDRRYMDYHSDRFSDFSLMFYKNGRLRALLPANMADGVLYSHQGLTFGGLLTDWKTTVEDTVDMFSLLNNFLANAGIEKVVYKAIPWIYHSYPSEEDLFSLIYVCKARLVARDISSSFPMSDRMRFAESRKSGLRKAVHAGVYIEESSNLANFWDVLSANLESRYNASPVHTLAEISLLKSRFPDNIRLYVAALDGKIVAGTVLYISKEVVHTQYISASPEGKAIGALDMLFDYIINKEYANSHFFDFGKSTEQEGKILNRSLIFQKEGFGGRGVCYDTYEWTL